MENSKQLFAARKALADKQVQAMNDGDEKAALIIQGQIEQLDVTLEHTLEQEEQMRNTVSAPKVEMSLVEQVLGARDEFKGIGEGFRAEVATIPAPKEIDKNVPGKNPAILANFAGTLQSVPADGSVSFLQRTADSAFVALNR